MVPTSLPDLPKTSRTPGKSQKPEFLNPNILIQNKNNQLISLLIPFLALLGGMDFFRSPPVRQALDEAERQDGGCDAVAVRQPPRRTDQSEPSCLAGVLPMLALAGFI